MAADGEDTCCHSDLILTTPAGVMDVVIGEIRDLTFYMRWSWALCHARP